MVRYDFPAPEHFEFAIGDEEYRLPVLTQVPMSRLLGIEDGRAQLDLLREYMGDAVDALPAQMVAGIFADWSAFSGEQGATLGE